MPAASQASRNITPGTGTAVCAVNMRSSSLVGSELRSPHRTAGKVRGRPKALAKPFGAALSAGDGAFAGKRLETLGRGLFDAHRYGGWITATVARERRHHLPNTRIG